MGNVIEGARFNPPLKRDVQRRILDAWPITLKRYGGPEGRYLVKQDGYASMTDWWDTQVRWWRKWGLDAPERPEFLDRIVGPEPMVLETGPAPRRYTSSRTAPGAPPPARTVTRAAGGTATPPERTGARARVRYEHLRQEAKERREKRGG